MKHWRALSRGTRVYYLVTMLLPLAEVSPILISCVGRMLRGRAVPTLDALGPWLWLAAPGILLGAASLVRIWVGHPPKDSGAWDTLLILTYIPDLMLLVMYGFMLPLILAMLFDGHR